MIAKLIILMTVQLIMIKSDDKKIVSVPSTDSNCTL